VIEGPELHQVGPLTDCPLPFIAVLCADSRMPVRKCLAWGEQVGVKTQRHILGGRISYSVVETWAPMTGEVYTLLFQSLAFFVPCFSVTSSSRNRIMNE
jgi:hypothetical protein